jgi:plasmid maintenance system antidote protein VapI
MLDQPSLLDIKIAMLRRGLRQYQVADELELTEEAFSKFMRGRRRLTPEQIVHLREFLGMAPAAVQ